MNKCQAIIIFGDDFGDNNCTFHCQLEEGHTGQHIEKSEVFGGYAYELTWFGDMTEEQEDEIIVDIEDEWNEKSPIETAFDEAWKSAEKSFVLTVNTK